MSFITHNKKQRVIVDDGSQTLRTTPIRPIQFRPKTTSPQVTSSQNHFAPYSADVFFCKPNPKPNP